MKSNRNRLCKAGVAAMLTIFAGETTMRAVQAQTMPEAAQVVVGHWRKTTIVYEQPRDEHLVLNADGTARRWTVTATDRSDVVTGRWRIDGKLLAFAADGHAERSSPFFMHEGQLVYPNIPNQRGFWDRVTD